MTQGQFSNEVKLVRIQSFPFLKEPSLHYNLFMAGRGNRWIHAFHKGINTK